MFFEGVDQETMDTETAIVEALREDIEDLWDAQITSIQATVDALADEQKGKYLAPIARLPVGAELRPEGLSLFGNTLFTNLLREIRVAKLTSLYP